MKIKRITVLMIVTFMIFALVGCSAAAPIPYGINEEGYFNYAIIRSEESKNTEMQEALKTLRNTIKDSLKCKVLNMIDTAREDTDNNLEILLGNTNRPESAQALKMLTDNRVNYVMDFIVVVIGDKICIQAASNAIVADATMWFAQTFCTNAESWAKLNSEYCFIYEHKYDETISTVNKNNLGNYSIVMPRQITYLVGMNAEKIADHHKLNGYNMDIFEDIDAELTYEILRGDCNREASKAVKVEGDNYVIKVVGNKVIIKGGSDLATWKATQFFYEEITQADRTKRGFNWSDGYTINGKYDAAEENAYTLNWYDEFEGSEIDRNKWGDYKTESTEGFWEASCLGGTCYWQDMDGNTYKGKKGGYKERQLLYQSDGNLHLGTTIISDVDFMGSQISSYWTMSFRYGLMEIRADLGGTPAATSLWFNGATTGSTAFEERFGQQHRVAMTEVDILENFGYDHYYASCIHKWWTNYDSTGRVNGSGHKSMDGDALYGPNSVNSKKLTYNTEKYGDMLTSDYRLFSMYWDEYGITFAFDGRKYCHYDFADNQSVSTHCLMNYIIMRCRMGGSTYGVTYDKSEHTEFEETLVDYVRVYQSTKDNCQMITAWPQHQESGTSKIFYPEHDNGNTY